MTAPYFSLLMRSAFLAMEAQQVIWLRMMRVAAGGVAADREIARMGTEKFKAAAEIGAAAAFAAIGGQSGDRIAGKAIRGYRKRVRANKRRLTK